MQQGGVPQSNFLERRHRPQNLRHQSHVTGTATVERHTVAWTVNFLVALLIGFYGLVWNRLLVGFGLVFVSLLRGQKAWPLGGSIHSHTLLTTIAVLSSPCCGREGGRVQRLLAQAARVLGQALAALQR